MIGSTKRLRTVEQALSVLLFAQFILVCAVKVPRGLGVELLWISHVALLLGASGLWLGSERATATALTSIFVVHVVWVGDCIAWLTTGSFPLGVTGYMADADVWTWLAAAHHAFLAPVLIIVLWRRRSFPVVSWLAATALFLVLTVTSRAVSSPAANVNYTYGVFGRIDCAPLNWLNRLPGTPYVLLLNVLVSLICFLSAVVLFRGIIDEQESAGAPVLPHCA